MFVIRNSVDIYVFYIQFVINYTNKYPSPTVHFCVSNHKKGTLMDETKQYIVYILNKHYMQAMGEEIYIIFDFTGAGLMNMV